SSTSSITWRSTPRAISTRPRSSTTDARRSSCRRERSDQQRAGRRRSSRRRLHRVAPPGRVGAVLESCGTRSERLQILDQIRFLTLAEAESEESVVVVDDVGERREAAVVIEAALRVRPEALQRRRPIVGVLRAAPRVLLVDADLVEAMHVPPGLREDRRNMAFGAAGL